MATTLGQVARILSATLLLACVAHAADAHASGDVGVPPAAATSSSLAALFDFTDPATWTVWQWVGMFTSLLVLAASVYQGLASQRLAKSYGHIPSPPAYPFLGHIPYLVKEPWQRFFDFSRKYGSVFMIRMWNKPVVVVSDPDLVKQMFVTDRELFPKDDWSYEYFKDILGYGLVTAEGDEWRWRRRMMSPAFHHKALERLTPVLVKAADRMVNLVQAACVASPTRTASSGAEDHFARSDVHYDAIGNNTAQFELSCSFRQVTLEVISEVVLGLKPEDASIFPRLFEAVLDELNARVFAPYRALYPSNTAHRKRVTELNNIVGEIIKYRRSLRKANEAAAPIQSTRDRTLEAAKRSGGSEEPAAEAGTSLTGKEIFADGTDVLDMMLDSGWELTDRQLSDEVKTQLFAGHETSSMMLTWACYLLARHPAAMAKAVDEVDTVLGLAPGVTQTRVAGAQVVEQPTFEAYKNMSYMEMVLNEAMRLFSPVPILNRETKEDVMLGKYNVPAHTSVMVSIWTLHLDPKIWGDNVNEFDPERFSIDKRTKRHPFAFMPFSMGPRNCIGQPLALVEAKIIMGSLLRRFRLTLADDGAVPMTDAFVIPVRPAERVKMNATPRA